MNNHLTPTAVITAANRGRVRRGQVRRGRALRGHAQRGQPPGGKPPRGRARQTQRHGAGFKNRGISLVEAVLSILLVGGVLISAINTFGGSQKARRHLWQQHTADRLSQDLLNEIRNSQSGFTTTINGSAPALGAAVAGLGNAAAPHRMGFHHPTHYHRWRQSPPVDRWGIPVPGAEGFTRTVAVRRVQAADVSTTSSSDQGIYEVKLTVTHGGRTYASTTVLVGDQSLDTASNPEGYR